MRVRSGANPERLSFRSIYKHSRVRPGANPKVEHLKAASMGCAMALPANIRLGWKGKPGTNALAYYINLSIIAIKSFIKLSPFQSAASIHVSLG